METPPPPPPPPLPPPPLCESAVNTFHAAAYALIASLRGELGELRAFRENATRRLSALEANVAHLQTQMQTQMQEFARGQGRSSHKETPTVSKKRKTPATPVPMENVTPAHAHAYAGSRSPVQAGRSTPSARAQAGGAQESETHPDKAPEGKDGIRRRVSNDSTSPITPAAPPTSAHKLKRAPRHSKRPQTPGSAATSGGKTTPVSDGGPVAELFKQPRRRTTGKKEPLIASQTAHSVAKQGASERRHSRVLDTAGCLVQHSNSEEEAEGGNQGEAKEEQEQKPVIRKQPDNVKDNADNDDEDGDNNIDDDDELDDIDEDVRDETGGAHVAGGSTDRKKNNSGERKPPFNDAVHKSAVREGSSKRRLRKIDVDEMQSNMGSSAGAGTSSKARAGLDAVGTPEERRRANAFAGLRSAGDAVRAAEGVLAARRRGEEPVAVNEAVRGEERKKLLAHACPECDAFFRAEVAGRPDADAAYRQLLQTSGRHKCKHRKRETPDGFWRLSFDDTPTQPPDPP